MNDAAENAFSFQLSARHEADATRRDETERFGRTKGSIKKIGHGIIKKFT